jgi:acyl-CoA thioester hydrolase
MEKPLYTDLGFDVKTYDIDFLGHVSNIVYVRWIEDLRLEMLSRYLPYDQLVADRISPVLMRTEVEYLKPVHMFESVLGEVWLARLEKIKMMMEFRFTVDGEVRATGRQEGLFISMDRNRPVRPPQAFRELVTGGHGD